MNTALVSVVLVCALSLSTQPLLGAADASPKQVVDTSGKKLRAGANYYIVPSVPITRCGSYGRCMPRDGGFALASIGESCPPDVVIVDRYHRLPVMFTPLNDKKGVVRVSTDLNIKFSTATSCPQTTVWKLDRFDASTNQWFVTTGGIVGNPGWQTIRNWFKIEEYEEDYMLVYCPSVCKSCKYLCKNVGVFVDKNGNKRLALGDAPYKVKFEKA